MRRNVLATLTVVALASVGAGCSSGGGSSGDCTAMNATELSGALIIQGNFQSRCFKVSAGSTISIQNKDGIPHTFTFDEVGPVSVAVPSGATGKATMPAAGTYGFHCTLHPVSMTGTVIVQ